MRDRVPFLGHYVSREGVEVDWPMPHTVKGVQAFSGAGVLLLALHPQVCRCGSTSVWLV